MVNPVALLKLKDRLAVFNSDHPRIGAFFRSIREEGLNEGAVLELKVTDTDGRERVANIRLTAEDIETIKMLESLKKDK